MNAATAADLRRLQVRVEQFQRELASLRARTSRLPVRFAVGGAGAGSSDLPDPIRQYDVIITQDGHTWSSAAVRAQGRGFSGF